MRLTLRTMLAYLDEILDPHDAVQLKKKIDESEFAASLVHRIRGSVRRLRLDAPALDAQGIGGDLNSVAEYLDNTLPAEHVPDFEKVCLESDVHLGEVASCHQILTLVLGEPAAVSDQVRQRVYHIGSPDASRIADRQVAGGATPATVSQEALAQPSRLSRVPSAPHIPAAVAPDAVPTSTKEAWRAEQRQAELQQEVAALQQTRRRPSVLRSLAITALIAFLITAALILAVGPLDQSHPLARFMRGDAEQVAMSATEPAAIDSESIAEATDIRDPGVRETPPTQMTNDPSPTAGIGQPGIGQIPPLSPPPANGAAADISMSSPPQLMAPANGDPAQPTMTSNAPHAEAPSQDVLQPVDRLQNAGDTQPGQPPEPVVFSEPTRLENPTATVPGDDVEVFEQTPPDTVTVPPILPPQVDTISPPDLGAPVEVTTEPPVANSAEEVESSGVNPPASEERIVLEGNGGLAADLAPRLSSEPSLAPEAGPEITDGGPILLDTGAANEGDVEAAAPDEPIEPGRLVSSKREVLLRLENGNGSWQRADQESPINSGDQLVSLPTFRPQFLLPSKLHCTLIEGTKIRLEQHVLALEHGRALLAPTPDTGVIDLDLAGQPVKLQFADDSSAAAIRVSRELVPGSDPENDTAHRIIEVYAATGSVQVEAAGQQFTIDSAQKMILVDHYSPRLVEVPKSPNWIGGKQNIPNVDRGASTRLQPFLVADRPATLSLQERAEDRRYDVRALAVRCLGHIDHFDALVAALNDPSQHSYWSYHVDTLRESLARGPETAARVRVAMEKVHGPEAQSLYEMLWGYNADQLSAGAAENLVENLVHNSLDHRVLAFENLKRITDGATLMYRPWLPAARRRRGVTGWRERLRKGLIAYKNPPEIVTLLNEFGEAAPSDQAGSAGR